MKRLMFNVMSPTLCILSILSVAMQVEGNSPQAINESNKIFQPESGSDLPLTILVPSRTRKSTSKLSSVL